ncbi:Phosphoribosyl 1,2-cyclic phosphodiesterase [Seinonella peptonophila]|uniref:Phosphoribosyl 1,2-cyclic phosphodiesterase n=1 Tax=Seinonella peptonophila TaxID=112248 RepID=A0A1M4WX80_9BACL|nr:MBL fold metallo-hydrolase [Seinonella peptonophila]SHE85800.1 Phosphoribosyl 1,2-cyclic phosphodiesterase [Seinonella peptonophila]
MKFSVLASSSTGNSIYIETDRARFLIDAGLSAKQLELRLKQISVEPETLSAIFVTHEHIDHVKGIGVLARRYQLPIYLNEQTWKHLPKSVGEIPEELIQLFPCYGEIDLSTVHIESFAISHDAAEPMAYLVQADDSRLAIVTDLGYVSQKIIDRVQGAHTLIWESNHDVEMLRMGRYPWNVKRRILSDTGHLSNQDSGEALAQIISGQGEQIYLAHLSQENNLIELAQLTVKEILEETGYQMGRDLSLHPTFADRPTPLKEVKRYAIAN